jgi:hypothetical protein
MTIASGSVAVIAAQVAYTDRRALSEAWYSALHLAREVAPLRAPATRIVAPPAPFPQAGRAFAAAGRDEQTPPATPQRAVRAAAPRGDGSSERRRPACEAERRIGRALATLAARPRAAAAQTVELAGGRVRLLVRSDGRTTRIVALCSAALREPVQRAVASARFALAGAGIAVGAP